MPFSHLPLKQRLKPVMTAFGLTMTLIPFSASSAPLIEDMYYRIGGAGPFGASASAGMSSYPADLSLGIRWNALASCGNFDIGASIANSLNGTTNTFQQLMGQVIQNAQSAVASLPAMIIQRSYPQLYELLSNGVLQGRLDFDKSKLDCQTMTNKAADWLLGNKVKQAATATAWQQAAASSTDPNQAQAAVEAVKANNGLTWVGGQQRGGQGQQPIRPVGDTVRAGYNILHGRTNPTTTTTVSGGGGGWGSVTSNTGSWPGGGGQSGSSTTVAGSSSEACKGGMCTVWGSPEDAANWTKKVLGESELQTCDDCEVATGTAGTGLMKDQEEEQQEIVTKLSNMVSGSLPITAENLRQVSAGENLAVSRSVIEAIRSDPESALLINRLANEMATARTLTKAMWARRTLLAGMSEPGIAQATATPDSPIAPTLNPKLEALNCDIDAMKSELEIRTALANNASIVALQRSNERRVRERDSSEGSVPESVLGNRGRPRETTTP